MVCQRFFNRSAFSPTLFYDHIAHRVRRETNAGMYTGLFVAPAFTIGQIVFLIAFVVYLAAAVMALVMDFDAFGCACAEESWVWLYVLLVTAIPTGLGFIMGIVKTVLLAVNLKKVRYSTTPHTGT